MDKETVRILQLLEFKILLEFKRICEKHNIQYFLSGGTQLGAVRHQGFIPWDDDVDVGLRRTEYEKFLKVAPTELGPEYFLQTSSTDPGYFYSFAKIRLCGTEYVEPELEKLTTHNEIWIDIFPFDNIPDNKLIRKIHKFCSHRTDDMCTSNIGCHIVKPINRISRICQIFCIKLGKILSKRTVINLRDWILQKPNIQNSELMWNWLHFKPHHSHYIESFSTLSFEEVLFPVPGKYHEYLTEEYGDYMQLPPENERWVHSPYEPKFGKYANIIETSE